MIETNVPDIVNQNHVAVNGNVSDHEVGIDTKNIVIGAGNERVEAEVIHDIQNGIDTDVNCSKKRTCWFHELFLFT